jgi:hypothetical protein
LALISHSLLGMQIMLDLSAEDAKREKYSYSRAKSKVLIYNSKLKPCIWKEVEPLSLAGSPIEVVADQEHLGINRSTQSNIHIAKDRVVLARRSLYAMMGAGMHGWNGVNPPVSIKLRTTYILPRMTHSLEAISVSKSDVKDLDQYQTTVLKQLQHLPERASNAATHLLLGAVPVSAHLHRAVFTFFCNMAREQDTLEHQILQRQLSMKGPNSHSWVTLLREVIAQYNLPAALDIVCTPLSKGQVKKLTRIHVLEFWVKKMKRDASHQITVRHLNLQQCRLGEAHHLWRCTSTNAREVKKACVKAKLLLGQYNLQTAKQHTNPTCPLCKSDAETDVHFILQCPKLQPTRAGYLEHLTRILQKEIPESQVAVIMTCQRSLLQVILDCTLLPSVCSYITEETLYDIEGVTRGLLYSLHLTRQRLVGPCARRCSRDVVCPHCIISEIDTDEQYSEGLVQSYAGAVLPCAGEEDTRR